MHTAITTRFVGPTNTKGLRIIARAGQGAGRSVIHNFNHSYDAETNHCIAAQKLAEKLGWYGAWNGGALDTGDSHAFVWCGHFAHPCAFNAAPLRDTAEWTIYLEAWKRSKELAHSAASI